VSVRGKAPHSPHMGGVVRVGTHHHPTPLQLPCRLNPTSRPSGRPGGWCGREAGGERREESVSPDRWSSAGGRKTTTDDDGLPPPPVTRPVGFPRVLRPWCSAVGRRRESRWFSRGRPRFSVGKSGTQQKTTGTVGTRRRKWGVPESPDSRGNPTGSWRPGRETVGDHGIPTIAQAVRRWSRRREG